MPPVVRCFCVESPSLPSSFVRLLHPGVGDVRAGDGHRHVTHNASGRRPAAGSGRIEEGRVRQGHRWRLAAELARNARAKGKGEQHAHKEGELGDEAVRGADRDGTAHTVGEPSAVGGLEEVARGQREYLLRRERLGLGFGIGHR